MGTVGDERRRTERQRCCAGHCRRVHWTTEDWLTVPRFDACLLLFFHKKEEEDVVRYYYALQSIANSYIEQHVLCEIIQQRIVTPYYLSKKNKIWN